MAGPNRTLTAVPGLAVGHAQDDTARTGCTVVLGPFVGAVHVHGFAAGTRALDALAPPHLVPCLDALLLTGGSAFGLAAADGVMAFLEAAGRGFETGTARIPIVPGAVIYDLGVGRADVRPGAEMGRRAASVAAKGPVPEGQVGAGCGATVGKSRGVAHSSPGGVGSWADPGEPVVSALAVVNAFGDVRNGAGTILAGALADDGTWLDSARALRDGTVSASPRTGEHTSLCVVALAVPLAPVELQVIARMAAAAFATRLSPGGTPFDGDVVFALSTHLGGDPAGVGLPPTTPLELASLGSRAQYVLEIAIERAVTESAVRTPEKGA